MAAASLRHRCHPSRWTLRTRLVFVVVALLSVVAAVIGTVSVVALEAYLTRQVDQQVRAAAGRAVGADRPGWPGGPGVPGGPGGPAGPGFRDGGLLPPLPPDGDRRPPRGDDADGDGPRFLTVRGQSVGTAGVRIENGAITSQAVLTVDGRVAPLSDRAAAALARVAVDGRSHPVALDRAGEYLALAVRSPDGDTVVTALPLDGVHRSVAQLALVVAVVTAGGLLAAAIGGTVILRAALRPLARTAAAAGRVAELPLDRGDVTLDPAELGINRQADPRTEVGAVDVALTRMLDHVGRALAVRAAGEARMRRFVSDASHELRTPLASIRGYAELTRRTSSDLPPDVAHAIGRVESEATRMTGLVEELLLLARLDEKPTLRSEIVDVVQVVLDATSDAQAAGPDHEWEVDLPDGAVHVLGDDARLHQVLANLLANARVHTPAGTTVQVRVRSEGGTATVEVVDDGPGIPADLLPAVFDRFARADSSRGRSAGGTGLGLAIVAGVVEAHGGRVEVTSRPGRTVFTVALPASPAPRGPARPAGTAVPRPAPGRRPDAVPR